MKKSKRPKSNREKNKLAVAKKKSCFSTPLEDDKTIVIGDVLGV